MENLAAQAGGTDELGRVQTQGHPGDVPDDNWGSQLITHFLYPFAMVSAPAGLFALMVLLVQDAFFADLSTGIRSFAAVLLPLMTVTYLYTFKRRLLETAERVPTVIAVGLTFVVGFFAMALLARGGSIPLRELVLSGTFSVLLFSRYTLADQKVMSFYFGVILGVLSFVIVMGFPDIALG